MKSTIKKITLSLLFLLLFASCITKTQYITPKDEKQTEILLVGTFHFDNPSLDIAKNNAFDILNEKSQAALENITAKIVAFNPTKIFVEWPYDKQEKLDSLYQSYKNGNDFSKDKSELVQLAFRVAKASKNVKLEAIDYQMNFPFDEVLAVMKKRNQVALKDSIMSHIKEVGTDFDTKLANGISLTDMLLYHNSDTFRYNANHIYEEILNAGNATDFEAANLLAHWNNRNLYMYSLLKKKTTNKDERVMVLLGASHIAKIKNMIVTNKDWKTVELKDILTKKTY